MTAVLIDRARAAMIWKDKAAKSQGQGGLAGCLMSGSIKGECLQACLRATFGSFPPGPKKRPKKLAASE
jgi:hypothetical protein